MPRDKTRSIEATTALQRFGVEGEDAAAFLQRRAANAALFATALLVSFSLFRTTMAVVLSDRHHLMSASLHLFIAATVPAAVQWLLCRRGTRTMRATTFIELTCTTLTCWLIIGSGADTPLLMMPALVTAFAVGTMLTLRAIYVPSPPRRTLVLAIAAGVPYMVMSVYVARARWTPEAVALAEATFGDELGGAHGIPLAVAWWMVVVAVTTAASHVIYGLRERVRAVQQLGQYRLGDKLGEGGMGVVYRAQHALLQRPTAVKLLSEEAVGETSLKRFEKEVQQTARLSHPNTITIYDYGRTPDGVFYYAMELLEGATLDEVVERTGPMPAARVLHILRQAAGSLAEAHGIGLVHRDIKPENLMLCQQGGAVDVVKVLDFGLVKEVRAGDDVKLTGTNVVVGTPQYMAPESIVGGDAVDARADLYSLAATAYFLLTGHDMFAGDTVVEICGHHLHTTPEPPSKMVDGVPPDLDAVIMRCLEKLPDDRPRDARELMHLLAACAGRWTNDDAAAWWQRHNSELTTHSDTDVATARTVAATS